MANYFAQFDSEAPSGKQPRGVRNNNPLNIEEGNFTRSQGSSGSDGRFAKFDDMDQGFAAAENLLGVYGSKHGINTISGVINRWAPPSDGNPVSAYAGSVSKELGIDANDPIDLSNPMVRARVADAMARFENGVPVKRNSTPAQEKPKQNYFAKFDSAGAEEAPAVTPPAPTGDSFESRWKGEALPAEKSSKIPAFIRDVPTEIANAAGQAVENLKGFDPRGRGEMGVFEGMGRTGKALLGIPELILSPVTGAARSLIGHPLADATHAAGTVINPAVAAKDDPKALYEEAKGAVDVALAAGKPGKVSVPKGAPAPTAGQDVALAGARLTENVSPVNVPRAISSDSMTTQRLGQAVRNVPVVGNAIPKATGRLTEQLETAAGTVANQFGGGSGPNVAHKIGQSIGEAGRAEAAAAKAAAEQSDMIVLGGWEEAQQAARQTIVQAEGAALQRARQSLGDMSPQDTGELLLARLRAGERQARDNKERLYGIAGETDGSIAAESVGQVRGRVAQALDADGRVIDGVLTPASSRMLDELQRFSTLNIENRAVGARVPGSEDAAIAAVNMQGIEQVRKRLNGLSRAASNDADRSAASQIIREFDNWLGDAFDNALFSGSDDALRAWRAARQANTEWRTRYGYNARDDADRVINRIVTGEVTPQEVANYVVGATKVGSSGTSSRLLTRIAEATAGDPEAINAIRGGVWNRLAQNTEGATAKAPEKIINDINEFLSGSGRDVARRLFTPQEQAIARAYASTLRMGIEARQMVDDVSKLTKPTKTEVGVGPLQKLANDILGQSGARADEALFSAINSYAKSGSRGDITLLSKVLSAIPDADKGDLAGAIIRQIGVSPRTGQFSPDVFVSSWNSYTPQAKSLLFGMSGAQRIALDDIAKISMRLKEVGSKFGNPSGTAQNVNGMLMGGALLSEPVTALATAVGGAAAAKVLSTPTGAAKVAKWAKAYEAVKTRPSEAAMSAFKKASSALTVNVSQITGAPIRDTLVRLGSQAINADEEQDNPR